MISESDRKYMKMAIELSDSNVDAGGGPFGAVIVRGDEVIATGANHVVPNNDPTAHAEVSAIREACRKLKTFKLEDCTIYTSCEPCPMCLSAIYWAGISRICYANTKADAAAIDFDDSFIYEQIATSMENRTIPCENFMREEAIKVFEKWDEKTDKTKY